MTYKIDQIPAQGYLHVVVTGEETTENLRSVWTQIAQTSKDLGTNLILCEGYLEGTGNTMALFDIGKEFPKIDFPANVRVAVVCKESKLPDFKFAETVAFNRGAHFVSVFTDLNLAIKWLTALKETHDSAPLGAALSTPF